MDGITPEVLHQAGPLIALIMLCVILAQILGRAVEAIIQKRKHSGLMVDASWIRRMDDHARRSHDHANLIGVLTLKSERTEARLSKLEQSAQEHREWSEKMTRDIAERLTRMETIGEGLIEGQKDVRGAVMALLGRLNGAK